LKKRLCIRDAFFIAVSHFAVLSYRSFSYPFLYPLHDTFSDNMAACKHCGTPQDAKEREQACLFPLKKRFFIRFELAEVASQQALKSLAVAGLIAGHLMYGLLFAGLAGRS
jgi:hypothetical protein